MRKFLCFLLFDIGSWLEILGTPSRYRQMVRAMKYVERNRLKYAWEKVIEAPPIEEDK